MKKVLALFLACSVILGAACGGDHKSQGTQTSPDEVAVKATLTLDEVSAALAKGLADHNSGQISEAQTEYSKVLASEPNNKFALYNVALINQTAGNTKEAETLYRQALLQDPNFSPALFNLAILRTSAPDGLLEAIDLYRHVIAVEPDNANAHLNLGLALQSNGQAAEGQAELTKSDQIRSR